MAVDYRRFENSIAEKRSYYDRSGRIPALIKRFGIDLRKLEIVDNGLDASIIGSHVMNSGNVNAIATFRNNFGFDPPDDFSQFYGQWDGGLFLFGVPYKLLSIKDIVIENNEFRKLRGHAKDAPWSIIRFADIGHNDFIGYRKKSEHWVVSLILNEYHDDELLAGNFEAPIISKSFSGWIDHLITTDGSLPDPIPIPMSRL